MPLLLFKTLIFSLIVPGSVAVLAPNLIAGTEANGSFFSAVVLMVLGFSAYSWCVWDFVSFGLGTPAPIDAPRRLVM